MKQKTLKRGDHQNGISLVELLIVIAVFAVIGVITTNSIMLTLRGARKSESQQLVRENLNYTLTVMERHLRGAQSVSPCPNASSTTINYFSADSKNTSFSCVNVGLNGYVASGSARLTSDEVSLTSCSLSCSQSDINKPPIVQISLTGKSKSTTGAESSTVSVQTDITLRN